MKGLFPLLILSLFAIACNTQTKETGNSAIVKVDNKYLYKEDVKDNIPEGLSKEDSIIAAENYIRLWIKDNLLYDIALKNVTDKENIDLLVENYRKSLIIYRYQEQLINEKISRDITDEEMKKYYDENEDKFKLDMTLVKGLYLKIPIEAPNINNVKEWYKSASQSSLEKIEKYSVQNAAVYDYFDHWIEFNELVDNLPVRYSDPEATVKNNKYIELQDSSYCYLINIKEYLLQGSDAPFEYAKPMIKEMLINQRKMIFLKNVEDDLYNSALHKGNIKFYTE